MHVRARARPCFGTAMRCPFCQCGLKNLWGVGIDAQRARYLQI